MTPRAQDNLNLTWNIVGKSAIAALIAWAAYEFREMRVAVYTGQTEQAVMRNRMSTVEKDVAETKEAVKVIEAKLLKEK